MGRGRRRAGDLARRSDRRAVFQRVSTARDGAGLSPLQAGKHPRRRDAKRPGPACASRTPTTKCSRQFAGQNNPLLENVKVFRWWGASVKKEQLGKEVVDRRPASATSMIRPRLPRRRSARGASLAFAIPADADWHNWTSDPSYLIVDAGARAVSVGRSRATRACSASASRFAQAVDLTQYELDAALDRPAAS